MYLANVARLEHLYVTTGRARSKEVQKKAIEDILLQIIKTIHDHEAKRWCHMSSVKTQLRRDSLVRGNMMPPPFSMNCLVVVNSLVFAVDVNAVTCYSTAL